MCRAALNHRSSLCVTMDEPSHPLKGTRILDCARVYAGPIVPDELVADAGQRSQAEPAADETLAAAVAWLTAGDACRRTSL